MANTAKKDPNDPERFKGNGINFRAKLIGIEDIAEARGDKLCQEAMQRLKGFVKASGQHKQKLVMNVSLEGLRIVDAVSLATIHSHAVHRISFISRDITDPRAFGYIHGPGDGTHKFYAIKTERAAEQLVLTLRDLFQVVYNMKKKEMEEAQQQQEDGSKPDAENPPADGQENVYQVPQNGAPVEGTENIYQVPTNNAPVVQEGKPDGVANLLDLEDQLHTLGQGIEQMNTLESMFEEQKSGDTAEMSRNSSQGSLSDLGQLQLGPQTTVQQPGFGANFGGFGMAGPGMQAPFPGQPGINPPPYGAPSGAFPANPSRQLGGLNVVQDPFANDPFSNQPRPPMPNMAPGGFGQQPQPGFGAPNPFGGAPGMMRPPTAQPMGQGGFGGAPFGAPATGGNLFGAGATQGGSLFPSSGPGALEDPNILQPLKPPGVEVEAEDSKASQGRGDFFSDLVGDIKGKTAAHKTPKDLFADQTAVPRKSLNQLKVEKTTAAITSSSPVPVPGDVSPQPPSVQASDPFGPLDKGLDAVPNMTSTKNDPFDTSFVHFPNSLPLLATTMTSKSDIGNNHHQPCKLNKSKEDGQLQGQRFPEMTNGEDVFSLPSPDEPPPPLPAQAFPMSVSAPPPPPRPRPHPSTSSTSSTSSTASLPAPVPPVPKPRKSLSKNSSASSLTNGQLSNGSVFLSSSATTPHQNSSYSTSSTVSESLTSVSSEKMNSVDLFANRPGFSNSESSKTDFSWPGQQQVSSDTKKLNGDVKSGIISDFECDPFPNSLFLQDFPPVISEQDFFSDNGKANQSPFDDAFGFSAQNGGDIYATVNKPKP